MDKFELLFELNKKIFNVYGKILTFKRLPLLAEDKKLIRKNVLLKEMKRSDKCYIVGLGPSLKKIDLTKLDGDIIVTNRFYKVSDADKIAPIAYVLCDNSYFEDDSVEDFKNAVMQFPETAFVLNGQYSRYVRNLFPSRKNLFYFYLWGGFISGIKSRLDCTRVLPMASNVVCAALYLGLYMGYKEINLLGCDFNSFAAQKKSHAYKDEDDERLWSMSTELFQYAFAADSHVQLNIYANRHRQKIFNATEGSLIDAYERKDSSMFFYDNHAME